MRWRRRRRRQAHHRAWWQCESWRWQRRVRQWDRCDRRRWQRRVRQWDRCNRWRWQRRVRHRAWRRWVKRDRRWWWPQMTRRQGCLRECSRSHQASCGATSNGDSDHCDAHAHAHTPIWLAHGHIIHRIFNVVGHVPSGFISKRIVPINLPGIVSVLLPCATFLFAVPQAGPPRHFCLQLHHWWLITCGPLVRIRPLQSPLHSLHCPRRRLSVKRRMRGHSIGASEREWQCSDERDASR